jgi:hypothetical protein
LNPITVLTGSITEREKEAKERARDASNPILAMMAMSILKREMEATRIHLLAKERGKVAREREKEASEREREVKGKWKEEKERGKDELDDLMEKMASRRGSLGSVAVENNVAKIPQSFSPRSLNAIAANYTYIWKITHRSQPFL